MPKKELPFGNNVSRSNPQLLVNSNNEMYNACRHNPRFHRDVKQTTPSTDQSISDERSQPNTQKLPQLLVGAMYAQLMSNWNAL